MMLSTSFSKNLEVAMILLILYLIPCCLPTNHFFLLPIQSQERTIIPEIPLHLLRSTRRRPTSFKNTLKFPLHLLRISRRLPTSFRNTLKSPLAKTLKKTIDLNQEQYEILEISPLPNQSQQQLVQQPDEHPPLHYLPPKPPTPNSLYLTVKRRSDKQMNIKYKDSPQNVNPLSQSEKEEIASHMKLLNDTSSLVSYSYVKSLTSNKTYDLLALHDGGDISEDIIIEYCAVICNKMKESGIGLKTVAFLPHGVVPLFIEDCQSASPQLKKTFMEVMSNDVEWKQAQNLLLPIFTFGHWHLAVVLLVDRTILHIYSITPTPSSDKDFKRMVQWLFSMLRSTYSNFAESKWKVKEIVPFLQHFPNSKDCGIFVMRAMEETTLNITLSFSNKDFMVLRHRMFLHIIDLTSSRSAGDIEA